MNMPRFSTNCLINLILWLRIFLEYHILGENIGGTWLSYLSYRVIQNIKDWYVVYMVLRFITNGWNEWASVFFCREYLNYSDAVYLGNIWDKSFLQLRSIILLNKSQELVCIYWAQLEMDGVVKVGVAGIYLI